MLLPSDRPTVRYTPAPWHFLNFFPLPQGHGSLRPTPAYGLLARTGTPGDAAGGRGPVAVGSAMRPSAAGLLATIFAGFGDGAPPSGPVIVLPAGGGGPTCTWSLSQRSASVVSRSCISPLNISNASDLYSISGSFWPQARYWMAARSWSRS